MTDPERFSRRAEGLAAELLRAGASERPSDHGLQQTLLALGLSGVVVSSTSVAAASATGSGAGAPSLAATSAASGSVGLTTAATIKTASAALVVKWLGIGVLGGVGLAGVAVVASPSPSAAVSPANVPAPAMNRAPATPTRREPPTAAVASLAPQVAVSAALSAPRAPMLAIESRLANPELDAGQPLAAEVAYVDRARALLASHSSQGLSLLEGYEQKFHQPRLLPEVLFLQLEAYERSGRSSEARRAAERLVNGFPKSPHAGRARRLLGP